MHVYAERRTKLHMRKILAHGWVPYIRYASFYSKEDNSGNSLALSPVHSQSVAHLYMTARMIATSIPATVATSVITAMAIVINVKFVTM
jgi:hypothetical protein